jgi:hypothetical protein
MAMIKETECINPSYVQLNQWALLNLYKSKQLAGRHEVNDKLILYL